MSVKKSFDVRRRKSARTKTARRKQPAPRRKLSLRQRREASRVRSLLLFCAGVFLAILASLYLSWRPEVRISDIRAEEESYSAVAFEELTGAYWGIVPRNSVFFYPEQDIRAAILKENPHVVKVSIARDSFSTLSIYTEMRDVAFWWCGTPADASAVSVSCYEADSGGLVFASAEEEHELEHTSVLRVYAELDTASTTHSYPLRARVLGSALIPDILQFAHAVEAMSVPLAAISIRDDEADLYTDGGTRITYVVGKEQQAISAAEVTLPTLNLLDGSILYVDLRFDEKAYVKKRSE
ncbi:hypothetical protein L0Y34_01610 [Candidatus Parcubacteria bacterium]|nr:hypothetical protein [Candidatus Parcubacteria bacterium]